MNRIALATLIAAATLTIGVNLATASPLGDCYNRVITSCNNQHEQGSRAQACAKTAMDACDKQHKGKVGLGIRGLSAEIPAPLPRAMR